jgi:hypothetical protein
MYGSVPTSDGRRATLLYERPIDGSNVYPMDLHSEHE